MKALAFCLAAAFLLLDAAFLFAQTSAGAGATLDVHLDQTKCKISPILHGAMTEEVSHAYDGGLYAELIQNRIFRDDENHPVHWSVVGADQGAMGLDKEQPVNDAMPVSLRLDASKAAAGKRIGIANEGFWGVPIWPQTVYRVSFYAKSSVGFKGPLNLTLETNDGLTSAQAQVTGITNAWSKYEATLTTNDAGSTTGQFILSTEAPGTLWFDLVSVSPPTFNGRPNGTRPDLMKLIADLKPKFLRLPGGNYLEGNDFLERFPWKKSVGPLELRPGHQGPWGYRSSDGFGLLEMLQWCEDLKMQPVLAVYSGYSLRQEHVEPGPLLTPYVEEALDEIEYITGDATKTYWGAMRAKDGHPAPFVLNYVEIGNEDGFDPSPSYDGRFTQFYDAIKARYPELQLIATMAVGSRKPDVIDEHHYPGPGEFDKVATQYDSYDRKGPKIFVGEWATLTPTVTPLFRATLSDAAWYTGLERNSDIVIMESYAPLLVNIGKGARQWQPNLIGYNSLSSFGSTSYWMLKMFAESSGDTVPVSSLSGAGPSLFYSVVRDTVKSLLYIKLVNTSPAEQKINLNLSGGGLIDHSAQATYLTSANLDEMNTVHEPRHIAPQVEAVTDVGEHFEYTAKPYSVTVLDLSAK